MAALPDGTQVVVAPITRDDAPLIAEGFAHLSADSRRLRFLSPKPRLGDAELRYLADVDGHDHLAIGARDPLSGRGIGIARYVRDADDPTRAEIAVTVVDDWRRRGVATILLARLGERARTDGVRTFTALVAGDNVAARALLAGAAGEVCVVRGADGTLHYEIEVGGPGH